MWPLKHLTAEEQLEREKARQIKADEKAKAKAERKLEKELNKEAKYYERIMANALARVGHDHWLRREARTGVLGAVIGADPAHQKVRFLPGRVREDAIYLRVDVMRLPHGTTILELGDEDTIATVSAACQRRVTFTDNRLEPERGVWYVVHRQGFLGAIPRRFSFSAAYKNIPKSAARLRYTAGVGANLKLLQPDLGKGPHLLIAGSPGGGKSVHMNSILMQFLLRNSPDWLQLYMIDLKGGMELQDYEHLPHVKGFVKEPDNVLALLAEFSAEMKRRESMFAARGVRDIEGWNRLQNVEKLPHVLLIVDELAQVLLNLDRKLAKDAGSALAAVISVSRATGGHAILCTQRPSSDIVLPIIKVNCVLRVAFRVPSHFDSMVVIDQGGAEELGQPGRAIMVNGPEVREIQTPLITPRMIRLGINRIMEGKHEPIPGPAVTAEDVARRALENYKGAMPRKQIEADFREIASTQLIRDLLESMDDSSLEIDGVAYQVVRRSNGRGGSPMRQLIPVPSAEGQSVPIAGPHSEAQNALLKG